MSSRELKQSVIIIDDSEEMRQRIREVIGTIPHLELIGEAENGFDAVEMVNSSLPAHIVLDVHMPEKSGIHVLKAIQPVIDKINVIVLSNHSEESYRTICTGLGASHFLDKTNEFSRLKSCF